MTERTWADVETELAERIPILREGDALMLRHGRYWTQFFQDRADPEPEAPAPASSG